MLPVQALLLSLLALMAGGGAWARGGGGFHGGGFHGGGGGGWHGSPSFRGPGGFPNSGWRGTGHLGGSYWAGRHFAHPGYGLFFGAYPFWPAYGYSWPYASYGSYYGPNIVLAPTRPPVYIEQGSAPSIQALEPGRWEFCANPEGYYPYVKECAAGWQTLDPQPQGQELGFWYYCAEPAGYYPYVRECAGAWRKIVP